VAKLKALESGVINGGGAAKWRRRKGEAYLAKAGPGSCEERMAAIKAMSMVIIS